MGTEVTEEFRVQRESRLFRAVDLSLRARSRRTGVSCLEFDLLNPRCLAKSRIRASATRICNVCGLGTWRTTGSELRTERIRVSKTVTVRAPARHCLLCRWRPATGHMLFSLPLDVMYMDICGLKRSIIPVRAMNGDNDNPFTTTAVSNGWRRAPP